MKEVGPERDILVERLLGLLGGGGHFDDDEVEKVRFGGNWGRCELFISIMKSLYNKVEGIEKN